MFKAFTVSTNEPVHFGQGVKIFPKSIVDKPRFVEPKRID
jgi:hypothetical protein